jgi:copper chaperone NosL
MTTRWQRFYERLGQPIRPWMRLLLVAAIVPLALGAAQRLWTIRFFAPQYPYGLELEVYTYTIAGGNEGKDLPEINTLNHYVGMQKLDPAEFADLDFLPFVIGALVLLTLRVAAIGDVRALVDLAVLTGYFGVFSLGRFVYMLYTYGHHLDPHAPIHMAGFMPPVIGTKAIANFSVSSYPALGTILITVFGITVVLLALWHLARALRPAAA